MTYNRLEAKRIKGEKCSFCKREGLPLVKMECCDKWSCCDTKYVSYRGGEFCQFHHENESPCHFHFNEKHTGPWEDCLSCYNFFVRGFSGITYPFRINKTENSKPNPGNVFSSN